MDKKIVCQSRTEKGKNAAGRIRRAGSIPANLIKEGKSIPITMAEADFVKLLNNGLRKTSIIELDIEGGEKGNRVIVKEIQRHPVTGKLLHVDFFHVVPNKRIQVQISVETEGNSKGIKAGGALEHYIRTLKVRTTPEHLVEILKVDITNLDEGDSIHLGDLSIPSEWDVRLQGNPIICRVSKSRASLQAESSEKAAS